MWEFRGGVHKSVSVLYSTSKMTDQCCRESSVIAMFNLPPVKHVSRIITVGKLFDL